MERLTVESILGGWTLKVPRQEAVDRLAAYEDTGLEPEEILTGLELAQIAMILRTLRAYGITPGELPRAAELFKADQEDLCVMLDMPRAPLMWNDKDETARCPVCRKNLMELRYGDRMILQCPECGQYLDDTKAISQDEAG